MKALQRTRLLLGVLLCAAVSAAGQPLVGALAIKEGQGDLAIEAGQSDHYGWAVDYETHGAARAAALRECGAGCSVVLTFERCGAYVGIRDITGGWGVSLQSTEEARLADLNCVARSYSGCVVRVSGCNSDVVEEELGLDQTARRQIQRGLQAGGFDSGDVDGLFGARTRRAIRRWQTSRGTTRATGYLDGSAVAALRTAGGAGPVVEEDNLFWQSIVNSTNPADFEAYLAKFPNGVFRRLAENRLASLRRRQEAIRCVWKGDRNLANRLDFAGPALRSRDRQRRRVPTLSSGCSTGRGWSRRSATCGSDAFTRALLPG